MTRRRYRRADGCTCGNSETMTHLPGCEVRPMRRLAADLMRLNGPDFAAFIRSTGMRTRSGPGGAE